ncbi:MAG: trypsin-like peptidase domain-containing protein [Actinoplanes sp.]
MDRVVYLVSHPDEPEIVDKLLPALTEAGFTVQHHASTKVGDSPLEEATRHLAQGVPMVICGTYRGIATKWVGQLAGAANSLPKSRVFVVQMYEDLDVERLALSRVVADYWRDPDGALRQLTEALADCFPEPAPPGATEAPANGETPHDYLDGLTAVTEFDAPAVDDFRGRLRPSPAGRFPAALTPWEFLQQSHVMRDGRLTRAGVLLFGQEPGLVIPTAMVQCTQYFGSTRTASREKVEIAGSVPRQIAEVYQFVDHRVREGDIPSAGEVNAVPVHRYPMKAVREVIANALVHRDYQATDMCVHVRLFADRLEVTSPGRWEGRSLAIGEEHDIATLVGESRRRNFRLAGVLTWIPLIEGEGSGLPTAVEECDQIGAPHPVMTQHDGFVTLVIRPRRPVLPSHPEDPEPGERTPLMDPARIAEIRTVVQGSFKLGSGYRVAPDLVLTAASVVSDAQEVGVGFDAGRGPNWQVPAFVLWADHEMDVALLRIEPPPAAPPAPPVRYARLADRHAIMDVTAAGFPEWKLREGPDGHSYRDLVQATGTAALLSNRRSGTLEIVLSSSPPDPAWGRASWAGMSGAAVWAEGRIVGVVNSSEGAGRLIAARIDRWLEEAGSRELAELLGIPVDVGLVDEVPSGRPTSWRSGYLDQVRDIAPAAGLLDRDQELAELAAFCASDESYRWIQGPPWAGKSALMAAFVLNPPPGVDVVSFFVTARLAGQADCTAFSDALIDQLAAIVGESVPTALTPSSRDAHRRSLLSEAARRSRQTGRCLVLVVDGLDEDQGVATGASIAATLPGRPDEGLKVIVSSRPNPPLPPDVPADHPLRRSPVSMLTPAAQAGGLPNLARSELTVLLAGPPLARDLVGLVASTEEGLTVAELSDLTGRSAYELEVLLGGTASRTLGRSDDGPVRFAHQSLLDTARERLGERLLGYYRSLLDARGEDPPDDLYA